MISKPNIFKYATKELSQDAFIFWLLDHANTKYENIDTELKKCALELIQEFFKLDKKAMPDKIYHFELEKQEKNIDIVLYINEFMIIIEDKTSTKAHGNQLIRYKDYAMSKVGEDKVIAVYFKTFDQSHYRNEIKDGFKIFTRKQLLNILTKYESIQSDIFCDFSNYIQSIEDNTQAFKNKEKWNGLAWSGFYQHLQTELMQGDWGYVANPTGGFMGFWWAFQKNEFCKQYLQIQHDKLVLKINSDKKENNKKFRNICYKHYLAKAKENDLNFDKPVKFGNGETMTILTTDYLIRNAGSGLVDIESTIDKLKKYTQFIEANFLSAERFI